MSAKPRPHSRREILRELRRTFDPIRYYAYLVEHHALTFWAAEQARAGLWNRYNPAPHLFGFTNGRDGG
jgi:hypothetical protein